MSSPSSGCGRSSTRRGQREINELHVPWAAPVKLTMTSRGRHPQLLRPRLPHQAGRAARALHDHLVPAHQGRQVPPLLRRVLRHRALADDRLGRSSWSREDYETWLSGRRAGGSPWLDAGPEALQRPRLRHLPPHRRARAAARPRRPVRVGACTCRTAASYGRRGLPPRVDPRTRRPRSSAGYQPIMPTFQGLVTEEGAAAADRLHQIAEGRSRQSAALGGNPRSVDRR